MAEEDRVVVIRFGHDWDPTCMQMDECLFHIAEKIKNFAVVYLVWCHVLLARLMRAG